MSDDNQTQSESQPKSARAAIKRMPGWKKILIGLSLVLALVGAGAQIANEQSRRENIKVAESETVRETPAETSTKTPAGTSGLLPSGQRQTTAANDDQPSAQPEAIVPAPSALQRYAPQLMRIGASFFVALILGTFFRMFLKMAAIVSVCAAGLFFALTYFNLVDLDADGVRTQYESFAGWASEQAGQFKNFVFAALPSSTSAAAGFFVGFKR